MTPSGRYTLLALAARRAAPPTWLRARDDHFPTSKQEGERDREAMQKIPLCGAKRTLISGRHDGGGSAVARGLPSRHSALRHTDSLTPIVARPTAQKPWSKRPRCGLNPKKKPQSSEREKQAAKKVK